MLSIVTLISDLSFASDYNLYVRKLTEQDGLSNKMVLCANQDRKGHIWFGTKNGLNRWNGYDFKCYTQKSHALPGNQISNIILDPVGNLWLKFDDSDQWTILNVNSENFINVKFKNSNANSSDISAVTQLNDKTMLIALKDGRVYRYSGFHLKLIYKVPEGCGQINHIAQNPQRLNYFWLIFSDLTMIFIDTSKQSTKIFELQTNDPLSHTKILDVDTNGRIIWSMLNVIASDFGINRSLNMLVLSRDTAGFLIERNFNLPISLESDKGYLLDHAAPFTFDYNTRNWALITHKDFGKLLLFDESGNLLFESSRIFGKETIIKNTFFDNSGNLWVTSEEGIYLIRITKKRFVNFLHSLPHQNRQLSARGFVVHDNKIYGGGYDIPGLFELDLSTGKYTIIENIQKEISKYYNEGTVVLSLLIDDSRENLWMGDDNHLVMKYHIPTKEVTKYTFKGFEEHAKKGGIPYFSSFWSIFEDKDGDIWVGTDKGFAFINQKNGHIEPYEDYGEFFSLSQHRVTGFYENNQGIWISSHSGLFLFKKNIGLIEHYAFTPNKNFPFNSISHINEDRNGCFWVSTKGGGIIQWIPRTIFWRIFNFEKPGMNMIYASFLGDDGKIWMSTDFGIIALNPKNKARAHFLQKDGIASDEFNSNAYFKSEEGDIFFGGLNGITKLSPKEVSGHKDRLTANLVIGSIKVWDLNSGDWIETFTSTNEITLESKKSGLMIDIALLNYLDNECNKYAYIIEGYEKNWNFIGSDNNIRIMALPYGRYTLKIKAQDQHGEWSSNEIVLDIFVPKPFYLSIWFLVFSIVLICFLFFLAIRIRIRNLQKIRKKLENEVKSRTEKILSDKLIIQKQAEQLRNLDVAKNIFFENISHELKTPLTLIHTPVKLILSEENKFISAQNSRKLLEIIDKNTQNLLDLTNEILDLSKLKNHKLAINEQSFSVKSFFEEISSFFDTISKNENIRFSFICNIDDELEVVSDKTKIDKIVKNLLANAFKFTKKDGIVLLKVDFDERFQLIISVEDNGCGISPEDIPNIFNRFYQTKNAKMQGGTGIGLALCKELTILLGGEISVESEVNSRTHFQVRLPVEIVEKNKLSLDELTTLNVSVDSQSALDETTLFPKHTQKKPTILIVEDNNDLRQFLEILLGSFYDILSVPDASRALDILAVKKSGEIDLLISDVMMPKMDGFEFMRLIKNDPKFQFLNTIFLTAKSNEEDRLLGLRIGIDDYIVKPFNPDELLLRISNLLKRSNSKKKYYLLLDNLNKEDDLKSSIQTLNSLLDLNIDNNEDAIWFEKVQHLALDQCARNDFSVDWLAKESNLSVRQFQRKILQITGLSPKKFINEIRLNKARNLLETDKHKTISQVMFECGFLNSSYFSKVFFARFGRLPSDCKEK